MPILRVKHNDVWEEVAGVSGHTHNISDIQNLPSTLPADVESLKELVGTSSVDERIEMAVSTKADIEHTHNNTQLYTTVSGTEAIYIPDALPDCELDVVLSSDVYNDFSNVSVSLISDGFVGGSIANADGTVTGLKSKSSFTIGVNSSATDFDATKVNISCTYQYNLDEVMQNLVLNVDDTLDGVTGDNDYTNNVTTHTIIDNTLSITGAAADARATGEAINSINDRITNLGSNYTHPETHPASMITGLATVATSGDYNDLINKPENVGGNIIVSDTYDATSSNAMSGKAVAEALETVSGATGSSYTHPETHPASMITGLANIATSGNYNDLINKPEEYVHPETHPANMIAGLADVAISGNYNDLSNKPVIPSIVGLATEAYVDGQIASIDVPDQVQADWTETDETSPAYIKNKPNISVDGTLPVPEAAKVGQYLQVSGVDESGMITGMTTVDTVASDWETMENKPFEETLAHSILFDGEFQDTLTEDGTAWVGDILVEDTSSADLTEGETYKVTWNGEEYECVCKTFQGILYIGNDALLGGADTGEPFVITRDATGAIFGVAGWDAMLLNPPEDLTVSGLYTCKIEADVSVVKQIDKKFIPIPYFGEGDTKLTQLIPETDLPFTFSADMNGYVYVDDTVLPPVWQNDWTSMDITWDGTMYTCVPQIVQGTKLVGNIDVLMGIGDNGIPFVIGQMDETVMIASMVDFPTDIYSEYLYTTLAFSAVDGQSYYSADTNAIPIVEGTEYKVIWDNVESNLTAMSYTSGDVSYVGVGNPSILGLREDTSALGYFIYTKTAADGTQSSGVVSSEGMTAHTFGIFYAPDVVHKVSVTMNQIDILTIDSKYISEVPWDKISDKPFGTIPAGTVIMPETTVNCSMQGSETEYFGFINNNNIELGEYEYYVEFDGIGGSLTAVNNSGQYVLQPEGGQFAIIFQNGTGLLIATQGGEHTLKITLAEDVATKIDPIYLPDDIGGSSLPEVTTDDNNKVMTVVDGVWAVQTPASGLPSVTTNDVGKFLRVSSSGVWVAETIPNAEEASF